MSTDLLEPVSETPPLGLMARADAVSILDAFMKKAEALRKTAETLTVTSVDDTAGQALARTTRLSLRSIRIELEKQRVGLVEEMTKETRRINSTAKAVKDFIEPLEERLLEQEQFVDREKERIRNELRQNRQKELAPYLTSPPAFDLGLMEPDSYATFLADQKDLNALRIQREKAAEEARIAREKADAEEREQMRVENERLRAEAAERERVAAEERRKADEELKALEETARKEREAAAAKQREIEAVAAEERRKAEAALRLEREAREAAERRQQEAADAENRRVAAELRAEEARRAEEAAAAEKAAAAPDKEKLEAFADMIAGLQVPAATSPAGRKVAAEVAAKVANFSKWIKTLTATL